ncbi:hypothetical protein CTI12_AA385780 [Artemisia annua]|uniref:Uncharacterized protein n=1 Tax=Artemisia annua TaxID=35608 RepID=A0A2U1M3N4_ARTAN|nr:hypothetical protein CTI12_AA385780 [Artemisia annua]
MHDMSSVMEKIDAFVASAAQAVYEEEEVDETGVEPRDIHLVMTNIGVSRPKAVKALIVGRPEHRGRDRHTCIAIRDASKLKGILDKADIPFTLSRSGRPTTFTRDPDTSALEFHTC